MLFPFYFPYSILPSTLSLSPLQFYRKLLTKSKPSSLMIFCYLQTPQQNVTGMSYKKHETQVHHLK